jgi:hypothetical protein
MIQPQEKRKQSKKHKEKMFAIPPHVHDTSPFCNDLQQMMDVHWTSLHKRKWRILDEFFHLFFTPDNRDELALRLGSNVTELPRTLSELREMFEKQRKRLDREMRRTKQECKFETNEEKEAFDLEAESIRKEFFYKWDPMLLALSRAEHCKTEWDQGVQEFRKGFETEVATWGQMRDIHPLANLTLTITFKDQGTERRHEFHVLNTLGVQELITQVKKQMGIRLAPGETLRLFSSSGPLNDNSNLNQYDPVKISRLTLCRIHPANKEVADNS